MTTPSSQRQRRVCSGTVNCGSHKRTGWTVGDLFAHGPTKTKTRPPCVLNNASSSSSLRPTLHTTSPRADAMYIGTLLQMRHTSAYRDWREVYRGTVRNQWATCKRLPATPASQPSQLCTSIIRYKYTSPLSLPGMCFVHCSFYCTRVSIVSVLAYLHLSS